MRSITAGFAFCTLLTVAFSQAQIHTATQSKSDPNSLLLISEAIPAITGGTSITDATMTGRANSGADPNSSGTITLKMLATQYGREDLGLPSGNVSLVRNDNSPDGCGARIESSSAKPVPTAPHQCWLPAAWFSPLSWLTLAMAPNAVTSYVGSESHNGVMTDHISVYQDFPTQSTPVRTLLQGLTSFELYLDTASHIPLAVVLADHPDNNAAANFSGEIQFSSYKKADSVSLPYEIKRFFTKCFGGRHYLVSSSTQFRVVSL